MRDTLVLIALLTAALLIGSIVGYVKGFLLSRLMLFKTRWLGIYLHIIRRPDYARCEHDHPWPFVTLILRGGYEEEVGGKLFARRPGYVGYRPRSFEHRITRLFAATAITLVVRGPDRVEWGFRLKSTGERVSWQKYITLPSALRVLWCNDNVDTEKGAA